MRRYVLFVTILVVLFAITAPATAQTLTEDNLLKLCKKSPDMATRVVGMVKQIEVDTSTENIPSLIEKGVPDEVIKALIARKEQLNPSSAATPAPLAATVNSGVASLPGNGVFAQTQKGLVSLPLEEINQKTPGMFGAVKTFGSMGLKKMEQKGTLSGTKSSVQLSRPVTIVFRGDYELIALEPEKGKRQFASVSMGWTSSNELKTLSLKTEMAEDGAKKAVLDLPDGEYGLIPVGTGRSTMYTFGVSGEEARVISSLR